MAEYEVVWEIKNHCPNNQMRDIFFDEIECDDPETYVRQKVRGNITDLSRTESADGQITIHITVDGIVQKFVFTAI